MVQGKQVFTYLSKIKGVTQHGEQYVALHVLTKNKTKMSFISKKEDVINKIFNLQIKDFQDISVILNFNRVYNREKRFSFWECELIDVGTVNN